MKYKDFSVLMSVYKNDKPTELVESLDSLFKNTVLPKQIVLVEDGELTGSLRDVLQMFDKKYPEVFEFIKLKKNRGLGGALSVGQEYVKYDYVARVDSDDIIMKNRFEKQLEVLTTNENVGLVGAQMSEFDETGLKKKRIVPTNHCEIKKRSKLRSPMNHTTVMFRTKALREAGGYRHFPLFEDYDLWLRMLDTQWKVENINSVLVSARVSEAMYSRRGGAAYLRKYIKFRYDALMCKRINAFHFLGALGIYATSMLMPSAARKFIYSTMLRK